MKILLFAFAAVLLASFGVGGARAYSYSAAGAEPLLDGRAALFAAVDKGDWNAAAAAVHILQPELAYLDQNEDKGVSSAFADAIAAKDPKRVRQAFLRAAADEIRRRLAGARQNIKDYQTAKALVVKAQRFYTAIAGDLPPDRRQPIESGLRRALDAIGNPGVFGVGARAADPAAFDQAEQTVLASLSGLGRQT